MGDRGPMPRLREQYKGNAVEVLKNVPAKRELRQEEMRAKAEEVKERDEIHQDMRDAEPEEDLPGTGGCDCGPECSCEYID